MWNSLTRAPKALNWERGQGGGKGEEGGKIKKNLTYIHHVFASYIIDLVALGDALLPVILAALLQRCQTLRNGAGLGDCALIGAHYLQRERERGGGGGEIKCESAIDKAAKRGQVLQLTSVDSPSSSASSLASCASAVLSIDSLRDVPGVADDDDDDVLGLSSAAT